MSVHKYAPPNTIETVLSTELNSLASSGGTAVSGEIDNSSGLYSHADFEIHTSQTVGQGDFISLYLMESEDGSNFEDGVGVTYSFGSHSGTGGGMIAQLIGSVKPVSGFIYKMIRGIVLPPTKFKIALQNWTASAFASSGNTVKMIRYNEQDVAS